MAVTKSGAKAVAKMTVKGDSHKLVLSFHRKPNGAWGMRSRIVVVANV